MWHVVFRHGEQTRGNDDTGHPEVLFGCDLVAKVEHAEDDQADDAAGGAEGLDGSDGK